jgi:Ca2+-binding EF-hand superfamily protein
MDILELKGIFEYELKRKLAQRSRSPIEELRKLISALKFYDFSNSMVLDKDQFIRGVLRTGLCGFNISDLAKVFDMYDPNKTGYINYLNFSRYLYGKEELIPIAGNKELNDTKDKSEIDKSKFIPPGLYERNIDVNDLENNSDIKIIFYIYY